MALTSTDETDLLLPLYQGAHEESLFSTFLERLRRRTQAEYTGIVIRRTKDPAQVASEFFAGIDLRAKARELGIEELYTLEGIHYDRLRPGRVYSVSEFIDHDPHYRAERERSIGRLGIVDERVVHVSDQTGISAWLIIARSKPCSAADSALLSNLSPYVAAALRSLHLFERKKVEAAISAEALVRSGVGWILFDRDARVATFDPGLAKVLAEKAGISMTAGERLRSISPKAERELAEAADALSRGAAMPVRTVVMREQPRIEALLMSADALAEDALTVPTILALCRTERAPSTERSIRLASLFDLPPREGELAIALSDGQSIAEAAEAMGLTIETARNYSKRLYAKLGVSGQAQLVRLVYESSAILA
ncbi:MAG: helix-turn-helix transcriptional regulator [Novosphingobium sp.]|nr:helix-turn-helix transcriptional regulator [Novosphingobium sp.]